MRVDHRADTSMQYLKYKNHRRGRKRHLRRGLRPAEALEQRVVLDGSLVISEFMADNGSTLFDEDGDSSDWLEVYNPTSMPIDLQGWHLTDDEQQLAKWTFPSVTIDPDTYLLVFASDKNRTDPANPLHTNFKIAAGGEYLALVQPDLDVAHEYTPQFPAQAEDISYGIAHVVQMDELVSPHAAARVFVPADDALGQTWLEPTFDDAAWTTGPMGIGFDAETPSLFQEIRADDPIAYWRLSETSGAMINQASSPNGFPSGLGGTVDSAAENFGGVGSLRGDASLLPADADAAARFDGVDDHVHIPDSAAIGNSGSDVQLRSIEVWFNADSVPAAGSGQHQVVFEEGGRTNGFNIYLYQGEVYFGAWTSNAGHWISSPVSSGVSYHAVMTYDSVADEFFAYLNGTAIGEQVTSSLPPIRPHSGDNAIGRSKQDTRYEESTLTGNGGYFDGVIDELALYNHILAADRVAVHYNAGLNGVPGVDFDAFIGVDLQNELFESGTTAYARIHFLVD